MMRKIEVITMFNANCLEIPNNSITHSLTHSKLRTNEKARVPASRYGFPGEYAREA
jgi:hypothetical protein